MKRRSIAAILTVLIAALIMALPVSARADDPTASPAVTAAVAEEPAPADATAPVAAQPAFEQVEDGYTIDPDNTGLDAEDSVDLGATVPQPAINQPKPPAPDDPEWGKTSFRPQAANVARRATLFDLPDPSSRGTDPFGTDPDAPKLDVNAATKPAGKPGDTFDIISAANAQGSTPEDEEFAALVGADSHKSGSGESVLGRLKGAFGKKSSGGSHSPKHGGWKGGAAVRSGLRVVDGEGAEAEGGASEEDLREEILGLGDDALICHDIWFVALGASDCDHAGMRAFLAQHRKQVRGSFVINLDSVAAGDLTVMSHEGLLVTRRADRRMLRMMTNVCDDLHIPVERAKYDWGSTDATPAMLSSMRGLTVMGTDASGMRALSHTAADVAENVVPEQAVAVAEAVTELIRRS